MICDLKFFSIQNFNKRKYSSPFIYFNMNRRRILMEIPPNLNERPDDSIFKMKEITKITNRCNKNIVQSIRSEPIKEEIEYIPYDPNSDDKYIRNFKKLMSHHKKFLNYFNTNSLENVINMYSDLKYHKIQLEKKLKFIKEKYKSQIKNLQMQKESDQNKIELLEKTISSLHAENDKTILIIEALQNENAILSEKNISENLNNQTYAKTLPITNINNSINHNLLLTENNSLKLKSQKQEIEYQNLKIEYQKLEIEKQNIKNVSQAQEIENQDLKTINKDLVIQNQNLQSVINDLKNEIDQIKNDKITEIQKIESYYTNNQKKDNDQLTLLVKKYKKKNELLELNKNTLEAENKTLLTSLNQQSFLKRALKSLKRQNFKLEVEVENLKMKNFKSPFQTPVKPKLNDDDMIDIGIITSFSENNFNIKEKEIEDPDFRRLYLIEKERRKILAILLSRIIKMFDTKCNQLLYDFSTIMNSQNARIQNIIALIHET